VRAGEQSRAGSMCGRDRKRFKAFLQKDRVETESEVGGLGELAYAGFRSNLPCRGSTHENGVGTDADEFASAGRECGIISEPPE
jgi:hypothetical protein